MSFRDRFFPVNRWLEPAFALLIAGGLIFSMWHLWRWGYLPQPFFYEPFDMYGDWFNVVYWAYDQGTYDNYRTVYPPLSFVFLRVFSFSQCYNIGAQWSDHGAGLPSRSCDWLGVATIHVVYVLTIILIARSFIKQDRRTALWRAYALGAGFPILEALEHGNLIIPTLALIILAFGPLVRSTKLRWLAIGLAVNFKVYVIAAIMPQLLRRRWRWVEGALLSTVAVYLVTFAMLGRGSLIEIYTNITSFASTGASTLLDVWFPATFLALEALLDNWESPMLGILGSRNVDTLLFVLPALQHAVQVAIVVAAAAAWFRPEVVSRFRLTNLGICLALVTSESGGYTVIIPFFFTFLEKWEGAWVKWAIIAVYILCIPLDIPVDKAPETVRDTYFPGSTVIATYSIMIGPFVRPLFFYSIPFALSVATVLDVWRDVRNNGWQPGWRFARRAPIGPGAKPVSATNPPISQPNAKDKGEQR